MKLRFISILALALICTVPQAKTKKKKQDLFPDGTPIPAWFNNSTKVNIDSLGKKYVITDYGVKNDSTILQTEQIQKVIDKAAAEGGGVIVIPKGTFLSGSVFFKQGVNLYLEEGGTLKGSDRIRDFKLLKTRMEGQTLNYFAALVNADNTNGFTIAGKGTINGNGYNYWEEFWIRRRYNRQCTNLEAMRPRLVYISNSKNVTVQDVHLINSPFWTNHIYNSEYVRYLDCYIYAPTSGVKAPSSDAIDLDVCKNVLIKGCFMQVNDDAVVLKGGKGTWADKDPDNGPNSNIIIEDCNYGIVHGCLTVGSESLHDRNIILRRCNVANANRVLWLKMRPDTPQHYEYITVEDIKGDCSSFLVVRPWTQFFKPEKRDDMPLSTCNNITIRNIDITSKNFFDVGKSDKYRMTDFTFENCTIKDKKEAFDKTLINNCTVKNVVINGVAKN
ncbi:rhamnogalacturonidase [Xylanibacter muris]|uniref:Exopolygalacturonase n=1 Tax=Xylanibacter muris TaxID=2736290 RepID=A0ABX2AJI3_9BACT|nr:glycosyl hydrolase family 28 protein [Xylanibacter muris]NPD91281.1 exopolygalacturonase [Xylanibacter muris]